MTEQFRYLIIMCRSDTGKPQYSIYGMYKTISDAQKALPENIASVRYTIVPYQYKERILHGAI